MSDVTSVRSDPFDREPDHQSVTDEGGVCGNHRLDWAGQIADVNHVELLRPWLKCDRPVLFTCEACGEWQPRRCGTTNRAACEPCGERHRRRVWRVARSGTSVAQTAASVVLEGASTWMLTLTAPGSTRHFDTRRKVMGVEVKGGVERNRVVDNPVRGFECACSEQWADRFDVGEWNAGAGARWNRLCQDLRRWWGFNAQYFKGSEIQDGKRRADGVGRGALHFHILLRVPPGRHRVVDVEKLRQLVIHHGFGHSMTFDQVVNERQVSYVAKYVAKASADRPLVPWVDLETGRSCQAKYRPWSASRLWGVTMRQVKDDQIRYWIEAAGASEAAGSRADDPLDNSTDHYTPSPSPAGVWASRAELFRVSAGPAAG